MEIIDELSALHIDQDLDDDKNMDVDKFMKKIADQKNFQLPNNHIPRWSVPLDRLFDHNDVDVKVSGSNENANMTECNLGIEEEPKYVKLSNSLLENQRSEYIKLLKEFADVFAWKYSDLKVYVKW